jgi:hypothetical protein
MMKVLPWPSRPSVLRGRDGLPREEQREIAQRRPLVRYFGRAFTRTPGAICLHGAYTAIFFVSQISLSDWNHGGRCRD